MMKEGGDTLAEHASKPASKAHKGLKTGGVANVTTKVAADTRPKWATVARLVAWRRRTLVATRRAAPQKKRTPRGVVLTLDVPWRCPKAASLPRSL
jgi:hypothetical protein